MANNENLIVEDTVGAAAPGIATTDENLSIEQMYQQANLPSLGKQIFSVAQIHGPTAGLFNIKRNSKAAVVEVPAEAQVFTCTPTAADSTVYTIRINDADYSYTSGVGATVAQITAGLVLEINITQTNGSEPVTAADNTTNLTLTANVPGVSFTAVDTGAGTIGLVETNANVVYVAPEAASENIAFVRADVEVYPSAAIKSGITAEAIEDIRAQYGKEAENIIGKLLRGLSNAQENTRTLEFLEANALADAALTLTDSLNAETNLFEITQKVHELVLKINSKNLRTYEAFAVIPFVNLAAIMALSKYAGSDEQDERGLFIAKIGRTRFYLNPDAASTTAYIGVKDTDDKSKSSAVFSPYATSIIDAVDPDTAVTSYHIYNRFAITASALHETDNEMLYKFTIN